MCGATGVCCDRSEITEAVVWQYRIKWVTRGLTQCQRRYCDLAGCQCFRCFRKGWCRHWDMVEVATPHWWRTAQLCVGTQLCWQFSHYFWLNQFEAALICSVTMGWHGTQKQTLLPVNQGVFECSGSPVSDVQSSGRSTGHLGYQNAHLLSSIDGCC